MTDPRRSFTQKQRLDLFVRAGGCCEICYAELTDNFEAHHVEPHYLGGHTEIYNGQALCVRCHRLEHGMSPHKLQSAVFFKDYGWQDRCVEFFVRSLPTYYSERRGEFRKAFIIEVSPSGGKTIGSMKLAKELIESDLIDKVVWVVPRNAIKIGFEDDSKLVEMEDHKRLMECPHIRIETDLKASYKGRLNNAHGVAVTYQSLPSLLSYFDLLARGGDRLMFVFDEAHHGAGGEVDGDNDDTANVWGEAMTQVRAVAHAVVCMTGTPVRTDSRTVPFFEYDEREVVNPAAGRITKQYFVRSCFAFGYKDAVASGVARRLIIRNRNPLLTYSVNGDERTEELAGVPLKYINHAKRQLLLTNQHGCLDDMLQTAFEENQRSRSIGDDDAAILVVVESQRPNQQNPLDVVARRIKHLFNEDAVTVESRDGPDASERIRLFKSDPRKARWIVAKNQISEGTNLPRIRQVCILRDIKSQVFYEQLVHRATRNDSDEVAQDAIVVQWHLPELYAFGCLIEDQTRLIVPRPKPHCPQCRKEIEYRPRFGMPCPLCGYEPEGGREPLPIDFVGLAAETEAEEVVQGGENFSKWDSTSRTILDRLGPNPRYGGRDGINEILRLRDNLADADIVTPDPMSHLSPDQKINRYWEMCERAGGIIYRLDQSVPMAHAISRVKSACKREAGMGRDTIEKVRREYPNPVDTVRRFFDAAQRALSRSQKMWNQRRGTK